MDILKIEGLHKKYGAQSALTDVDLVVPKGCIFGLLGPNGAGKTTLIRIVNQIIDADSGNVSVNGELLAPKHIKSIGYLPEERGLYKRMKVGEQLLYFAQLKGLSSHAAKGKVKYWLEKLEITAWVDKKIEDLSKGMAQKIQFISTVIHDPEILILDEPFSGFDPVNAEIIKNVILELKEKGTTVMLSTHRMESVELLCDHIAMINKSHKVLDGPVHQVKDEARSNTFEVKLRAVHQPLPEKFTGAIEMAGMVRFDVSLGDDAPNDLLKELMGYGEVVSFSEKIPSIEEIFIQKVKESEYE
ncbi:ATP-binding cassette domain-containing protein [Echinicola sp. CAU 1574]|uniref:ATP-binding cassette domain-containing protein n=1 Tax=Echinicola arenosa TaxID=2774144 RepID=A0ABR9AHT4_9BACT|nr:ATP-binding cassette domain-containing protein [Echinicola arenosa]MBD8488296.1 ATP-binding cassette domain-containing protein [Echinicola arenosa]